jgi:hypothetical protein
MKAETILKTVEAWAKDAGIKISAQTQDSSPDWSETEDSRGVAVAIHLVEPDPLEGHFWITEISRDNFCVEFPLFTGWVSTFKNTADLKKIMTHAYRGIVNESYWQSIYKWIKNNNCLISGRGTGVFEFDGIKYHVIDYVSSSDSLSDKYDIYPTAIGFTEMGDISIWHLVEIAKRDVNGGYGGNADIYEFRVKAHNIKVHKELTKWLDKNAKVKFISECL